VSTATLHVEGDAFDLGLPKWPAMTVIGDRVSEKVAAEIIIRTEHGFPDFWSNSKRATKEFQDIFGYSEDDSIYKNKEGESDEQRVARMHAFWDRKRKLQEAIGCIELEYLCSSRITSAYIGGPHGWCNWNGEIFSNGYNIGKWPSVESVAQEWERIGLAFPMLKLKCWLYDEESCESTGKPVVMFEVANGQTWVRPATDAPPIQPAGPDMEAFIKALNGDSYNREVGIHPERLRQRLIEIYGENYPRF
jgi:hypothetical protein